MLALTSIAGSPLAGGRNAPDPTASTLTIIALSGVSHYGQSGISKRTVNTLTGISVATTHDVRSDSTTEHSYLVNGKLV